MTAKTRKAYDAWAESYDSDLNPHLLLEHDDFLELVDAKPKERILDAACGTGRYTEEVQLMGATVVGIDFSNRIIETAREKNPLIDYRNLDLRKKLPFPDSHFDKITCGQALKHIRNLKFTFKEFNRLLKKDGKLIFSVTHPDMDWTNYVMRKKVSIDLTAASDMFEHKFSDYFQAIVDSGFKIDVVRQIPVNLKIKDILTTESFKQVKGRYEVIIFRLSK